MTCAQCGGPFTEGQGKRFNTVTFAAYHDDCWPFVCCAECGYDPAYGKPLGLHDCYCGK